MGEDFTHMSTAVLSSSLEAGLNAKGEGVREFLHVCGGVRECQG